VTIRIAALEVSHWHALYDAAYLRQLRRMPGVEPAAVHDPRPDFVLALGRHDRMADVAHGLLDRGLPFLMEKPMGLPDGNPAYHVLREALTAWRDGRPSPADAEVCWRSVRLIDDAYRLAGAH
jgi:hypothetical protein